ncbi:phosphatase domain-containing putative toxin [Thalassotalea hakodatensis]|uniref:phosphatase domain-containing putative toxin n=1 Tax=Thalassotalea hakodatensis TaxID=3030492 RepID=UPI0025737B03|nr:dual specificity protein phosphatase family protein [Thalassotalea hakodatensis]
MYKHPFDTLTLESGGKFIFTPCPGTQSVNLQQSIEQLRSEGVTTLVSLMYDDELVTLDAHSIGQVCQAQNLTWLQMPIKDDDAPNDDFMRAFSQHITRIINSINKGEAIAVHCKGGSGRTGLVIALFLIHLGYDKAQIVDMVQLIRPKALQHPIQRKYFNDFIFLETSNDN